MYFICYLSAPVRTCNFNGVTCIICLYLRISNEGCIWDLLSVRSSTTCNLSVICQHQYVHVTLMVSPILSAHISGYQIRGVFGTCPLSEMQHLQHRNFCRDPSVWILILYIACHFLSLIEKQYTVKYVLSSLFAKSADFEVCT